MVTAFATKLNEHKTKMTIDTMKGAPLPNNVYLQKSFHNNNVFTEL